MLSCHPLSSGNSVKVLFGFCSELVIHNQAVVLNQEVGYDAADIRWEQFVLIRTVILFALFLCHAIGGCTNFKDLIRLDDSLITYLREWLKSLERR